MLFCCFVQLLAAQVTQPSTTTSNEAKPTKAKLPAATTKVEQMQAKGQTSTVGTRMQTKAVRTGRVTNNPKNAE